MRGGLIGRKSTLVGMPEGPRSRHGISARWPHLLSLFCVPVRSRTRGGRAIASPARMALRARSRGAVDLSGACTQRRTESSAQLLGRRERETEGESRGTTERVLPAGSRGTDTRYCHVLHAVRHQEERPLLSAILAPPLRADNNDRPSFFCYVQTPGPRRSSDFAGLPGILGFCTLPVRSRNGHAERSGRRISWVQD